MSVGAAFAVCRSRAGSSPLSIALCALRARLRAKARPTAGYITKLQASALAANPIPDGELDTPARENPHDQATLLRVPCLRRHRSRAARREDVDP